MERRTGNKHYFKNGIDIVIENHYHLCMANEDRLPSAKRQTGAAPQTKRMNPGRVSSGQLLGERGELVIEHEGREYHLRLTQNHKLILTA